MEDSNNDYLNLHEAEIPKGTNRLDMLSVLHLQRQEGHILLCSFDGLFFFFI